MAGNALSQLPNAKSVTTHPSFAGQLLPFKCLLYQNSRSAIALLLHKLKRRFSKEMYPPFLSSSFSNANQQYFDNNIVDKYSAFKLACYLSDELLLEIPPEPLRQIMVANERVENEVANLCDNNQEVSLYWGFQLHFWYYGISSEGDQFTEKDSSTSSCRIEPPLSNHDLESIKTAYSLSYLNKSFNRIVEEFSTIELQKQIVRNDIAKLDFRIQQLQYSQQSQCQKLAIVEKFELELENELKTIDDRKNFVAEYASEFDRETETQQKNQSFYQVHTEESSNLLSSVSLINNGEGDDMSYSMRSSSFEQVTENTTAIEDLADNVTKKHTSSSTTRSNYNLGDKIHSFKSAHTDSITCLDFAKSWNTLCTAANYDNTVKIWDLSTTEQLGSFSGHKATINCLQMSNNNSLLMTGSKDATVKVWNIDLGIELAKKENNQLEEKDESPCVLTFDSHSDEITALSFDGEYLISASRDKTVRQYDIISGKCFQTLATNFGSISKTNGDMLMSRNSPVVGALQYYNTALITGSSDGIARLWDLRIGKVVRSMEGHNGAITSLQFDPIKLTTSSTDGDIRVWDLRTAGWLELHPCGLPVTSFDSSPPGLLAVISEGEERIRIIDQQKKDHWFCGESENVIDEMMAPSSYSYATSVKCRDDRMVEGRSNGTVNLWAI
ncbi:Caf4p NDAI_0B05190 [Naumovozyma dairenensis CBS 421]|uniref:Uncharacterized protein n=1 Tax=Naumovozyma dairenensis (strain ATCC 10597 / BCRC 20456 / CBS 421 / NBRC 0211 / NRRL Y-12639) TaxID=1071378 RepID=G0W6Z1_NAUDC|nr:hypothetical protein NDAI_0B05190 [Naumovozyma dairenensis CBS 421]CCD23552.1 hypothetical protein NDAI_0B05190 [Naumovozyma dairenensis CBS 421]